MAQTHFEGNWKDLLEELPQLIGDEQTCSERQIQIETSLELEKYSYGARILLNAKEALSLEGDFSTMEKICEVSSFSTCLLYSLQFQRLWFCEQDFVLSSSSFAI